MAAELQLVAARGTAQSEFLNLRSYLLRPIIDHIMMRAGICLCFFALCLFLTGAAVAEDVLAPEPQSGTVIGTVLDVSSATVPDATVVLEGPSLPGPLTLMSNDRGFFQFDLVKPGRPYHVTISANGFASWTSPEIILKPGQYFEVTGI